MHPAFIYEFQYYLQYNTIKFTTFWSGVPNYNRQCFGHVPYSEQCKHSLHWDKATLQGDRHYFAYEQPAVGSDVTCAAAGINKR